MVQPTLPSTSKDDFTFDYGDVSIKVNIRGQEVITGKVSSSAMSLASPVWKKFIFPPFRQLRSDRKATGEATTNGDATTEGQGSSRAAKKQKRPDHSMPVETLDFTSDDSDALLVLLRIAHMKFKKIPTSLSYDRLVNLAILCDEYDCADLVRPWFKTWFRNEISESCRDGREKWLFIAWVFGRERAFDSLSKKLLKETCLNKDGVPMDWNDTQFIPRVFLVR
jgi:hypothetical protein